MSMICDNYRDHVAHRKPLAMPCRQGMCERRLEVRHQVLNKGEILFSEGEPARHVYVLRSGLVRLYRNAESGHQALVRLVRAGELFGFTSLLGEEAHSLSADGIKISELCVFSAGAFFQTLESDPSFTRNLLWSTAKELRATREDLLLRVQQDATGKIASHLIDLNGRGYPSASGSGAVPITRTLLRELTGTAPETVSRVLGKLESAGLIERRGRSIWIRDQEGLRRLSALRMTDSTALQHGSTRKDQACPTGKPVVAA